MKRSMLRRSIAQPCPISQSFIDHEMSNPCPSVSEDHLKARIARTGQVKNEEKGVRIESGKVVAE